MKTKNRVADLYCRVSTEDQTNGYSQRHQEEVLRRYCEINSIQIRKVIFEDHSAKSFEGRPEWKKMLTDYRKHKGLIDLVLFLKWDRFSRNAGDSYAMISTLNKLGIEPQAVEQALDLSTPESKLLLAMYLAMPEVENLRRGLNVLQGMRRARKEGRHISTAPLGYANKSYETGRKYIAPKEPEAGIIRWAFTTLAAEKHTTEELWRQVRAKGLKCSKNNFWHIIVNPIYCGKIFVPPYQQEEGYYVPGQHEPLVTEELFYTAQDVLFGRKRKQTVKVAVREEFPLRNFLVCPKCGKMITASASKGRTAYYNYYHCTASCGWRYKAEHVHDLFIQELRKYKPQPAMLQLYKQVILDVYNSQIGDVKNEKKLLLREINEQNSRLAKARELLLAETLDASDYKAIKSECERQLNLLEAKLSSVPQQQDNIDKLLDKALYNLSNVDERYENADVQGKRLIIGSMFCGKLQFENNAYRTTKVNEAVELIFSIDKAFRGLEKGQAPNIECLYQKVIRIGLEPFSGIFRHLIFSLYKIPIEKSENLKNKISFNVQK